MTEQDAMRCSEVITWLSVMQENEAAKLLAPHFETCPECLRCCSGLRRLARWVGRWEVGPTQEELLVLGIGSWTAARLSPRVR